MRAWNYNLVLKENQFVCTALYLEGFGEGVVVADDKISSYDKIPSLAALKKHLRYCVEQHDNKYVGMGRATNDWKDKRVFRTAMIYAFTSDTQPDAEKYLEELGFQRFGPIEKLKHPNTKLSMWMITSVDFLTAIKE